MVPAGGGRAGGRQRGTCPTEENDLLTVHCNLAHCLGYDHAEPPEHEQMFVARRPAAGGMAGRAPREDVEA
jgi:ssRNA-specific RNase YbeY (16S rRNA maturation enzyme)